MVGWWRPLAGWGGALVLAGRHAIALCFKPSRHQATHYRAVPRADTMGQGGGPSTKRLLGRAGISTIDHDSGRAKVVPRAANRA
jgi:hypothetical protein